MINNELILRLIWFAFIFQALVPLSLANRNTIIVMAGDDKQLGPRVLNKSAKQHGLECSIMERLSKHGVYQNRTNRRVCTNFVKNYRNHECIVKLLSHLFYNNTLQSCASMFLFSLAFSTSSRLGFFIRSFNESKAKLNIDP
jgi:superfamily I DNA and/or RNA helicase